LSAYQTVFIVIFWVALLLLFQSYLGTFLSLLVVSAFLRKKKDKKPAPDFELPDITILIPAYNEERVIGDKLENLLSQDYPTGRMEILVVSDYSTDRTGEIVRTFGDRGVRLKELKTRLGKPGIIDEIVPDLSGEIVVITDANVILAPDAVRKMMEEYSDPAIGAVCGDLPLVSPSGGKNVQRETTYRHYEILLKRLMGKLGAVIGAYGGFYSQRRTLFRPLGKRPIHDDVIIPLEVLAQGYKVIYARQASAVEETNPTIRDEYRRRIRMTAFNLNTMPRMIRLAFKAGPKVLYLALCYKLCRWISPYLFAVLFISSLVLVQTSPVYGIIAILFCVSLLLAGVGWLKDRLGVKRGGPATDLYHFAAMNFAAFVGLSLWLRGVEKYWKPRGM